MVRMIKQCCVCHKVENKDGEYVVDNIPEGALVSHGYCLRCKERAALEIKLYYRVEKIKRSIRERVF